MDMQEIIIAKRDGRKLTAEQIRYFVKGYVAEQIPDYQAAALLMAICINGLDREEIFQLTDCMRYSGDTIDLSAIPGIKIDKHSTGGVGDKTTLIVGPIAAAAGVSVAKMSGRGLGFTGGTIDKLESIPGFCTARDIPSFMQQVQEVGIAITGQTGHITPADKKIYALRDVTGTVDSMGLIASSIMSKKLAAGSDGIVLDVKCGKGAFMDNQKDAETLAQLMCDIGTDAGRRTVAVITDMEQPLGNAIGNGLEVKEAIDTLQGNGPADITALSRKLAGVMIYLGGCADTPEEGEEKAARVLASGAALQKLEELIAAQGGNPEVVRKPELLPQPEAVREVRAETGGYIAELNARIMGTASQRSGAGRETKEDAIDLAAGILLNKKVGDPVEPGELLATVYGASQAKLEQAEQAIRQAVRITEEPAGKRTLILDTVGF